MPDRRRSRYGSASVRPSRSSLPQREATNAEPRSTAGPLPIAQRSSAPCSRTLRCVKQAKRGVNPSAALDRSPASKDRPPTLRGLEQSGHRRRSAPRRRPLPGRCRCSGICQNRRFEYIDCALRSPRAETLAFVWRVCRKLNNGLAPQCGRNAVLAEHAHVRGVVVQAHDDRFGGAARLQRRVREGCARAESSASLDPRFQTRDRGQRRTRLGRAMRPWCQVPTRLLIRDSLPPHGLCDP